MNKFLAIGAIFIIIYLIVKVIFAFFLALP